MAYIVELSAEIKNPILTKFGLAGFSQIYSNMRYRHFQISQIRYIHKITRKRKLFPTDIFIPITMFYAYQREIRLKVLKFTHLSIIFSHILAQ